LRNQKEGPSKEPSLSQNYPKHFYEFTVCLSCFKREGISILEELWTTWFLEYQIISIAIAAKSWKSWTSLLGISKYFEGSEMALIQLEMWKLSKASILKGQSDCIHIILAISQPRKTCWIVSTLELHMGQDQTSELMDGMNLANFALVGRISQAIFQRKCFGLCWSFEDQIFFQSAAVRGPCKLKLYCWFHCELPEGEQVQTQL
jgi:hypothetical protein